MRDLFAMLTGANVTLTTTYVALGRAGDAAFYSAVACAALVVWLALYLADVRK